MKKIVSAVIFATSCSNQITPAFPLHFNCARDLHSITALRRLNPEVMGRILDASHEEYPQIIVKTIDKDGYVMNRIVLGGNGNG